MKRPACKHGPNNFYSPHKNYKKVTVAVRFKQPLEYRKPKRGEYYISGAIAGAYQAPNDLSSKYFIGECLPVSIKIKTTITLKD